MTREEAIFCEGTYLGENNCINCKYYATDTCESRESHKMAIAALEAEPCENAVSREAVIEITAETGALETQARVKALPPVTPARKKGEFTRQELENWLYTICFNNIGTDFCEDVLEIISRLDGFEKYVEDMRGGE